MKNTFLLNGNSEPLSFFFLRMVHARLALLSIVKSAVKCEKLKKLPTKEIVMIFVVSRVQRGGRSYIEAEERK